MKTLHLYLARQVLATLGMTVFVFTLVLLLGNVLKQLLDLLVKGQVTPGLAAHAILLLIPYVLAFSLPIGMLTATLLVFGRFSADQELTAARASGISLLSLISPVLLIGVAASVFCAWLNFEVAPSSRVEYLNLLYRAGLNRPGGFLESKRYVPFGKYTVFAGKVDKTGTNLGDVMVSEWDAKGELVAWTQAARGELVVDTVNNQISLQVRDASSASHDATGWTPGPARDFALPPVPLNLRTNGPMSVSISDMTFRQLRGKLDELEQAVTPVPPRGATKEEILEAKKRIHAVASELTMPVLVYLNQQVAFSFACIGFTLVGIPLGVRAHRRETSAGVAMALVLVLVYYSFMVLSQAWESHPERAPDLIVWLPNFIFQAAGGVLLWRVNNKVC